MTGPLSHRIAELCDEIVTQVGPHGADQVRHIGERLGEPLRVAIAGRLKAGKSTLVNALIGRRVAPTAVGECTRVVTRFRYGTADRVDVVGRDGSRRSLPLDDDGMIPGRLGVPASSVAYVDVALTTDRLRDLTVVDTPGLASADQQVSERAHPVVGVAAAPFDDGIDADSTSEIAAAEAVVYVFTQAVRADDANALAAFRASTARLASSPINAVGVLGKIDTLVAGPDDPWPVAVPLAAGQARLLQRTVGDVVPLAALIAETGEAGRLTTTDVTALRTLAALPGAQLRLLLASADLFRTRAAPVEQARRERLLRLLDLYGVGFALAQLAADPRLSTGDLIRRLVQASGMPRLRHTLDQAVRWRSDAIKAGWALAALERLAGRSRDRRDRAVLRDAVERLLRDPAYHRLRLLDVAHRVTTGAVPMPDEQVQELTRLAVSDDPRWILRMPGAAAPQLREAAVQAAHRWRAYAHAGGGPAQSRAAQVAHRGFHLLAQQTQADGSQPPTVARHTGGETTERVQP
ncbi:dynamin family protein [Mangrovihabitans endophyticus]|uniref:Isoniazid inducible gene protein IniC n=1 Tax=Mangrovihabitans endophyticus TaxID=1751298 RepID=A0A8J3FRU5_9ACTN|nr:dynamin family protein [Mangrovihabitans endophyticus]GGL12220.1 isoniazid inducible gene protein IniC [Mangrovihabitans endophyticus]